MDEEESNKKEEFFENKNSKNDKKEDKLYGDFVIVENLEDFQENFSVILSRKARIYIFILFLVLSVVVDLDNGIFSASVDKIKEDLDMDGKEYGIFLSISFIGRIVGLVFFMIIINFKHRKFTLVITIFLHGLSYGLYSITTNAYILIFAKMFAAGNKVCASVYRPVWIEQFGLSHYKSIFFSLVQIMSSYGQVIGFNLATLIFGKKWKLALLFVMFLMIIIGILFLFAPGKYFHRKYMYYGEKLVDTVNPNEDDSRISETNTINDDDFERMSTSSRKKKSLFISSKTLKKKKNKKYSFKTILKDLCSLLKNKIYLLSIIKRSNNTFIFQIIHSYLKPYQENVLNNYKEKLLVLFYNISSLLTTAIGGLLGGIITKFCGGYENKKSILVLLIPEVITVINIFFLSFTKDFYIYNINLMLFFLFISAGSPVILGYLIKTIPKPIKGIGIGLDMIVSTFLGKIPSPIIYGALDDKYSKTHPNFAWKFTLSYFYIGFIIILFLCYFKYHEKIIEDSSEVNLEDQVVEIAAIGSGTDANDHFSLQAPVPKRAKSTVKKKSELIAIFKDDNIDEENSQNLSFN